MYNGSRFDFEVVFGPVWQAGSLRPGNIFTAFQGVITYRSIGLESDVFIQVLDKLYQTKIGPRKMRREAAVTGLSISGDPRDLVSGPVAMKLFLEPSGDNDYAELYTNVALAARRLEVHEKDAGYRMPIVRALCGD